MLRNGIIFILLLLLLVALWPPAGSLYDLTGEEETAGQMRGLLHWLNTAIRPQPDLAPQAALGLHATSPFGVNTFLQLEVLPEVREESLRRIRDAGFRFIRQEFTWEDIEISGKGDFIDRRNDLDDDGQPDEVDAWAKYDNIVDLAEQYDMEIIARLSNPPSWTRAMTDTIGPLAPPDDFTDYGDFVAAVVERYAGRVNYFQLWNEPNIYPEWGEQAVNPEAFTQLLCEGYRRAKEANPQAVILAPALSPTVELSGRNFNNLIFLQRMYDAGAGACFDILSAQGYGLWSGPTDRRLRPTVINYPHHLFLRDVMVRNGDAAKPIWLGELGWNVAPEGVIPSYGRVTEEQQARYAVQAYERAQAEWPWVEVLNYWFFKRPGDSEKGESWYYFRMMEPDFTPLPVWEQLSAYASQAPTVEPRPAWLYTWQQFRPALALFSGSLLFLLLLYAWLPED